MFFHELLLVIRCSDRPFCLKVAQDFPRSFYTLPPGALDALINCTITALSLQERYSLVQASNFIVRLRLLRERNLC